MKNSKSTKSTIDNSIETKIDNSIDNSIDIFNQLQTTKKFNSKNLIEKIVELNKQTKQFVSINQIENCLFEKTTKSKSNQQKQIRNQLREICKLSNNFKSIEQNLFLIDKSIAKSNFAIDNCIAIKKSNFQYFIVFVENFDKIK